MTSTVFKPVLGALGFNSELGLFNIETVGSVFLVIVRSNSAPSLPYIKMFLVPPLSETVSPEQSILIISFTETGSNIALYSKEKLKGLLVSML